MSASRPLQHGSAWTGAGRRRSGGMAKALGALAASAAFILSALAVLAWPGATAWAQASAPAWPARPIRLIVPLPPGGSYDYLARIVAERLQPALGQPMIVENRVGADGRIGAEYVARQPGDGYTILIIAVTHVIHPSLFKSMPYDVIRDFAPVGLVADAPFVLLVNPSVKAANAREFVDAARARPGAITFASSGVGSPYHLGAELLKSTAGVDMLHVPYKGTGPLINALLGGEVMSAFAPIGPFLPHIRAGKLKPLGIVTGYQTAVLPGLPTVAESLNLPDYAMDGWLGIVAPAATPRPIIERLNSDMVRIVRDPQFTREKLVAQSYEPIASTPERMGEVMRAHLEKYARIVRDAKIPPE
jgi:tripartite-type tricarboxylate transporter receptor subunit TctC